MISPAIIASRFKPTRLSSCSVWLSGADPNNGALPANNSSITSIINKGWQSGLSCTQPSGGSQAIYLANQYNGKGILRTDGTRWYNLSGFTYGSAFTIFSVFTHSSTQGRLAATNNTNRGPDILTGFNNSGIQNYEYYNNTDRIELSTSATGLNICEVVQTDGVNLQGYFNGNLISSITPTMNASGISLLYLFTFNGGANDLPTFDFASHLIFNAALSAADRSSVRHYLGDFFGVSVV